MYSTNKSAKVPANMKTPSTFFIPGGENIYPREIEEVLFAHSAVSDVAVVGIPDDRWGERVAVSVRLAPGQEASEEDLDSFERRQLAPHKAPRDWILSMSCRQRRRARSKSSFYATSGWLCIEYATKAAG